MDLYLNLEIVNIFFNKKNFIDFFILAYWYLIDAVLY